MKNLFLSLLSFILFSGFSYSNTTCSGGYVFTNLSYVYHCFTNNDTLVVNGGPLHYQILLVAGGGAGCVAFEGEGGGGGAGGVITNNYGVVAIGNNAVVVGVGGSVDSQNGGNSSFGTNTAIGGGGGGSVHGEAGGSGGGGAGGGNPGHLGGSGTSGQGFNGGNGLLEVAGGGGGASEAGTNGVDPYAGKGGNGLSGYWSVFYCGAGGGGGARGSGEIGGAGVPGGGTGGGGDANASSVYFGGGGGGGGGADTGKGARGMAVIRYPAIPGKATNLYPANNSTNLGTTITMSWNTNNLGILDGSMVWFGISGNLTNIYVGTATNKDATGLSYNTQYQWRIDISNSTGVATGDVMTLYTADVTPRQAINPSPANQAFNQLTNVSLTWSDGGAGTNASTNYNVWFGISNSLADKGTTSGTTYAPSGMTYKTNYQWRIDSINQYGVKTGIVWSFSTVDPARDWYVATSGTNVGTSWTTATSNLYLAVGNCASGYTVWIDNGTYIGNFIVGGGVTVRSRTGLPADVILNGNASGRVVTMTPSSWLIGCTASNGLLTEVGTSGAGISEGSASNCVFTKNVARQGGGASFTKLFNCLVFSNTASVFGGGGCKAEYLYNCTIVGNVAAATNQGGGLDGCVIVNCISWGNNAIDYDCQISYSCGSGDVYLATNNCITNDPLFVSATNLRLQPTSPCINIGTNGAWAIGAHDLDGNLRVWPQGGTVDMGVYEYGSADRYNVDIIMVGTGLSNLNASWPGANAYVP